MTRFGRSSPRARIALALLVVLSGALLALLRGWNEINVGHDSPGYVEHSPERTIAYPFFIAVFDRTPGASFAPTVFDPYNATHEDPDHRLVSVVHAQKIFTVLAIAVLAWALSEVLSVWLVGGLLLLGTAVDAVHVGGSAIHFNIACISSEGINHALVFLHVAALFGALVRSSWLRKALLSLSVAALLLTRPANVVLVATGLLVLWIAERERSSWRRAYWHSAAVLALATVPLAFACLANEITYGHAKLHAVSGLAYMSLLLQVADENDVSALEDPQERAFLHACVVGGAPQRIGSYTAATATACIDANLTIVTSASRSTITVPPGDRLEWARDPILARVAQKLVARHPAAYARLVSVNARSLFVPWRHAMFALTLLAAVLLYVRSRRAELLFASYFTVSWLAAIAPACLCLFPIDRYRSQLLLAEYLALPLLVALLLSLGRNGARADRRARPVSSPPAVEPPGWQTVPVREYLRARDLGQLDVEKWFLTQLILRNGVWKTTYSHRLDDLNELTIGHTKAPRTAGPLRILDLACSSGVSTVEMHQAFQAAGFACETTGTDILPHCVFVESRDGTGVLFDAHGLPIQVDLGGRALTWRLGWDQLIAEPLLALRAWWLLHRHASYRRSLDSPLPGYVRLEVPLVTSEVARIPGIKVVREDIQSPVVPGPFDVIRAANILNVDYFGTDAIRSHIRGLAKRLTEGGGLVVCRTREPGGINHATVFRLSGGHFVAVADLNKGSEIRDLVQASLS
jgi:hypothetical protein